MLPDQDDPFFHGIFTRTRRLVMCISGITRSVFIINEHMLSVAVPRSGWDCLIHCQINQAGWSSFIAEEINSVNPSYRQEGIGPSRSIGPPALLKEGRKTLFFLSSLNSEFGDRCSNRTSRGHSQLRGAAVSLGKHFFSTNSCGFHFSKGTRYNPVPKGVPNTQRIELSFLFAAPGGNPIERKTDSSNKARATRYAQQTTARHKPLFLIQPYHVLYPVRTWAILIVSITRIYYIFSLKGTSHHVSETQWGIHRLGTPSYVSFYKS